MRLFIAVPLPEAIAKQLATLSDKLRKFSDDLPINWVKPGNIHLTLKFLGMTTDETAAMVEREIKSVAGQFQPIRCKLGGLGAFPNISRPRVIWTGLDLEDNLADLQRLAAEIDRATSRLGFEPESRPFSAHLTLGRVKVSKGKWPEETRQKFANLISHLGTTKVDPTKLVLERIVLFRSILKPDGPVYERLYQAELGREELSG